MNIRQLLQLPLKLTLQAMHLCLCCHIVLKQLALLQAIENATALNILNGQFLNMQGLDDWNGTVVDFAHGMIPI
jgi:hypothetical protein